MSELSVVIPVFNEEENILELINEVKQACIKSNHKFEIIIVDDGSTDGTRKICQTIENVKYLRFRKNFGQTAAFDAGIKQAKYNYIITMDGDRQNDPADIDKLINYLEENNLDVVSGWRRQRKDSVMKKLVSRVANLLRSLLVKDSIHDSGCSLKIYKRECFEQINLYGEMHRFIPAILKIKGFEIGEVEVNHRFRTKGKTKYNWRRAFRGFVDMISVWFWNKYAVKPLHLLGGIGFFFMFIGSMFGLLTLWFYLDKKQDLSDTLLPLMTVFFVLIGVLLFVLGLISDILSKTYYGLTIDKSYNIKEIVDNTK